MRRLNQSEYLFAGKVINAKVVNGKLTFRIGGGYIMFDEFLSLYAKEQAEELREFAQSENMSYDEVVQKFEQHYIEDYYSGLGTQANVGAGQMSSPNVLNAAAIRNKSRSPLRDSITSPNKSGGVSNFLGNNPFKQQ